MIYTVGNEQNYLIGIASVAPEPLTKLGRRGQPGDDDYYPGGAAFQTIEEAKRAIEKFGKVGEWAVWGLDCTWDNTYSDPLGRIDRLIIEDANIVLLAEADRK